MITTLRSLNELPEALSESCKIRGFCVALEDNDQSASYRLPVGGALGDILADTDDRISSPSSGMSSFTLFSVTFYVLFVWTAHCLLLRFLLGTYLLCSVFSMVLLSSLCLLAPSATLPRRPSSLCLLPLLVGSESFRQFPVWFLLLVGIFFLPIFRNFVPRPSPLSILFRSLSVSVPRKTLLATFRKNSFYVLSMHFANIWLVLLLFLRVLILFFFHLILLPALFLRMLSASSFVTLSLRLPPLLVLLFFLSLLPLQVLRVLPLPSVHMLFAGLLRLWRFRIMLRFPRFLEFCVGLYLILPSRRSVFFSSWF